MFISGIGHCDIIPYLGYSRDNNLIAPDDKNIYIIYSIITNRFVEHVTMYGKTVSYLVGPNVPEYKILPVLKRGDYIQINAFSKKMLPRNLRNGIYKVCFVDINKLKSGIYYVKYHLSQFGTNRMIILDIENFHLDFISIINIIDQKKLIAQLISEHPLEIPSHQVLWDNRIELDEENSFSIISEFDGVKFLVHKDIITIASEFIKIQQRNTEFLKSNSSTYLAQFAEQTNKCIELFVYLIYHYNFKNYEKEITLEDLINLQEMCRFYQVNDIILQYINILHEGINM